MTSHWRLSKSVLEFRNRVRRHMEGEVFHTPAFLFYKHPDQSGCFLFPFRVEKGNKVRQQVDIPEWVKKKRPYAIACLRGLIDTDGCVIIHRYRSRGKLYRYGKIGYTSRSFPLLTAASGILSELGIGHRMMKGGYDIRIEAMEEVKKYFQIVGTSNPKHLKRYAR